MPQEASARSMLIHFKSGTFRLAVNGIAGMFHFNMAGTAHHIVIVHTILCIARNLYFGIRSARGIGCSMAAAILKRCAACLSGIMCLMSINLNITSAAHIVLIMDTVLDTTS